MQSKATQLRSSMRGRTDDVELVCVCAPAQATDSGDLALLLASSRDDGSRFPDYLHTTVCSKEP